jgi:hypothetical protein
MCYYYFLAGRSYGTIPTGEGRKSANRKFGIKAATFSIQKKK